MNREYHIRQLEASSRRKSAKNIRDSRISSKSSRRQASRAIDAIDLRILAGLSESARRPNADIAQEIGISESTVRKRIARLIADEVIRIAAVANPLKIGYPVVAIFGLQCLPSSLREVEESLAQLEEFRFIGLTTGAYDFAAEAWFQSMDDLSTFITERLGAIEGIRQIQTANVLKMVRYTYDWGTGNPGLPRNSTDPGSSDGATTQQSRRQYRPLTKRIAR